MREHTVRDPEYVAIVWLGTHGPWSKGGFATYQAALDAAYRQIASGAWGSRTDLVPDVECK